MPKYMTAADRADEAETLMAAFALVRRAGLQLDDKLPILPPQYAGFLIAPHADLLIVPSTTTNGSDRKKVSAAMRLARCNALIVRVSRPSNGAKKVLLDVGLDGPSATWHQEYRACLLGSALHLVPDHEPSGPMFRLTESGLLLSVQVDDLG